MQIIDDGDPCTLAHLRPGLFRVGDSLGLKTEYGMMLSRDLAAARVEWEVSRWPEAFVVDSGEVWWSDTNSHPARAAQIVQPVTVE